MRRIERDPELWEYSEDSFRHLEASLLRAELKRKPLYKAIKGSFIGMSLSIAFWWAVIYGAYWVHGLVKR